MEFAVQECLHWDSEQHVIESRLFTQALTTLDNCHYIFIRQQARLLSIAHIVWHLASRWLLGWRRLCSTLGGRHPVLFVAVTVI